MATRGSPVVNRYHNIMHITFLSNQLIVFSQLDRQAKNWFIVGLI
jgi:hypothetical protein